jgi:hypothetical protein
MPEIPFFQFFLYLLFVLLPARQAFHAMEEFRTGNLFEK